jgi:KaiC/GvpD/RAD55 family RecA-like ATPase
LSDTPFTHGSAADVNGGKDRPRARPIVLADLIGELVTDAEERLKAAAEGRPRDPVTGLPVIDQALGGGFAPGLHVFAGDPGGGKTALAKQTAVSRWFPSIYVTAEQAPARLFQTIIAQTTETPLHEVRNAAPAKVRELATRAAAAAPMVTLLDAAQEWAPWDHIQELAEVAQERFDAPRVLIVIDSLQAWAKRVYAGDLFDVCEAGLSDLVKVTSALRAPAIVISHRNRASANQENPNALSAAKGTADFEHLAETVIHLKADKREYPGQREWVVTASLGKNRRGPAGFQERLTFDGDLQTFRCGGAPVALDDYSHNGNGRNGRRAERVF